MMLILNLTEIWVFLELKNSFSQNHKQAPTFLPMNL